MIILTQRSRKGVRAVIKSSKRFLFFSMICAPPLRKIDGYSKILIEDYAGKIDQEGNRIVGIITENAQKMGQLIDDLLHFSQRPERSWRHHYADMTVLLIGN